MKSLLFASLMLASEIVAEPQVDIMERLKLDSNKTETVKHFPEGFAQTLIDRGAPLIYTKENSKNFEYIGMPVGGIAAGQLYLGGDGKLWFWDIFNLNFKMGQLKGEEAYEFPYVRSKPNEKGARMVEHGFRVQTRGGGKTVSRILDRNGIEHIEFLGQYPIGEVRYRDPELPVDVDLQAYSPFVPLNLDQSMLPATILNFKIHNRSSHPTEVELAGWLENAVLTESRKRSKNPISGKLVNRIENLDKVATRLVSYAEIEQSVEDDSPRPDILFEDFEDGYAGWTRSGRAFGHEGKPYYNYWDSYIRHLGGERLADSRRYDGEGPELKQGEPTGSLVSQPFLVERKYIRANTGGYTDPQSVGIRAVVDGKTVDAAGGSSTSSLKPVWLDLRAYQGKEAHIEIYDKLSNTWGTYISVDDITFTDRGEDRTRVGDNGSMALTVIGGKAQGDAQAALPAKSPQSSPQSEAKVDLASDAQLIGSLTSSIQLEPGQEKEITFVLSWHFPTTAVLDIAGQTRHYAEKFKDAREVSQYVIDNYEELSTKTNLWRDTWYDSTLPYWFLDRTFLNTSILASSTSHLLEGRHFYGFEGGYQGEGTCTHVWSYVQAMGRLFPELEINLREKTDLLPVSQGGALQEDGTIKYRWFKHGLAVDGQAGIIFRSYLAHQMSKDNSFLIANYGGLKKAMQGLTQLNDADHDGILTGPQHNTLDAKWYGKITWLSLYYGASLRAMAEMADEMGDREYASFCREIADRGRDYIENELFNGEYFIHEPDPDHPNSPGVFSGNEYSQLLGQSWAYHVGMGEIIDPKKATAALDSLWKYNFTTDVGPFREVHESGRWYAMPGEGGFIACTWPNGGSEVLEHGDPRFAAYNNESQNGYEYALSSLMMWHDMPYRSLAHIWYMHNNRYHGSKRNPWSEVEWGIHYSRSMASYGHFVGVSGFEYHGPRNYIAFSPKVTPSNFKAPFVTAGAWGSFSQNVGDSEQSETLSIVHGKLEVQSLAFDVSKNRKAKSVTVRLDKKSVPFSYTQEGERVFIALDKTLSFSAEQSLNVTIKL
ncbi:GH116 family glycosyl-hydrolase [Pelagicoccus sp. SDUM812005]|uniref:GH116 family glycosyl-hydrolase n=1 Tax=Pelagicoccus sp. SDUM812005 TaxID=3041257 RepID=UPI0028107DF1|nr:GH116 family glycosyl-hydrolase [Pelagicoccus sp. SDUM812005]MDQ8180329.1 GH116 family glycosyl-hydrolase [Pelagicoccus sp. SDUM812005]